jgi:uncharacterized protein (UPF0332 family)
MEPRQFLETAKTLADLELEEPDWRSAISRAYYASFLDARELLDVMQFAVSRRKDTHQEVRKHFTHSSQSLGRTIARELSILHAQRLNADYEMADSLVYNVKDAEFAIAKAKHIIDLLDRCRQTPGLYSSIQASIKYWLDSQAPSQ